MLTRLLLLTVGFGGLGAGAAFVVTKLSMPLYEGRSTVSVAANGIPALDARAAALTVLKSQSLFHVAVDSVANTSSLPILRRKEIPLFGRYKVSEAPSGNIIELRTLSTDPTVAANLANALVDSYNQTALHNNFTAAEERKQDLAKELKRSEARLVDVQKRITDLQAKSGVLDPNAVVQNVVQYRATLNASIDQYTNQLQTLSSELAKERQQLAVTAKTTVGNLITGPTPQQAAIQIKLQELIAKRTEQIAIYQPTSSVIKTLDDQIDGMQKNLAAAKVQAFEVQSKQTTPNPLRTQLEQQVANTDSQVIGLRTSLKEAIQALTRSKAQNSALPVTQAAMSALVREKELDESYYKQLRASSDTVSLQGTSASLPTIQAVFKAIPGTSPVSPDVPLVLGVGTAIGLVIGLIAGLSGRREVVYVTAPVQAPAGPAGPSLTAPTSAPPLPMRKNEGMEVLALPSASPAEAYRFMVFAMQSKGGPSERTIIFTGVSSDSLCAEAAAQFAIAMAQTGTKTLLADFNLRHQVLTNAFRFAGKSGISDVLSKTMLPTPGNTLMLETEHQGLFFLPCGSEEFDGLGNTQNIQIAGLVEEISELAEVKVLNTPPCSRVSDAPRLVRYADQVCLVASKADQQKGLVAKAEHILTMAGAKSIEVLVIDAQQSRESFLG